MKSIAMWSGPRNISTALMRSWGNRPDTFVTDEPLYAHYLLQTGAAHPGREEVIASQETDWRRVAEWLSGPPPEGKSIWYQKHMAHHLLPGMEREWLGGFRNCFLIRDPCGMLPSLTRVLGEPGLEETGLPQQVELFEWVRERTGETPPVIDAADVLRDPPGLLRRLCEALEVPFTETMLSWPSGPRATDGVWAKYWYASVEATTTFEPFRPKTGPDPEVPRALYDECAALYEHLYEWRLR